MHSQYMQPSLKTFAVIIFLLFISMGMAVEKPPVDELRSNFPYAELSASHIDLGVLKLGRQATGSISIHNTGVHPLLIATVRSSCGLMTPSWPTKPIGAGEKVTISFRYDANRPGPFERIITIHTNSWQKTLAVKVTGNVESPQGDIP